MSERTAADYRQSPVGGDRAWKPNASRVAAWRSVFTLLFAVALLAAAASPALAQHPDVLYEIKRPEPAGTPVLTDSLVSVYSERIAAATTLSPYSDIVEAHLLDVPPENLTAEIGRLVGQGLRRLSPGSVERRARIRFRMMELADEFSCALLANGAQDQRITIPLLLQLDHADFDEWIDIVMETMASEARQFPAAYDLDEDGAFETFLDVGASLPPAERKRFWNTLLDMDRGTASDAAACWADKTMYQTIFAFEPARRIDALRVLVSFEAVLFGS